MHHLTCSFENKAHVVRRVLCNDGTVRALAKDIGKLLNESNVSKQLGKYNLSNLTTSVNPDILDSFTNNERNSLIISLSSVNDYIEHRHKKEKYNSVKEYLNEHWNDGIENIEEIKEDNNSTAQIDRTESFTINMKERSLCFIDHTIPFGYDKTGHVVFRGINVSSALGYARPDKAILEHTKPSMRVTTVYNIPEKYNHRHKSKLETYTKYLPSTDAVEQEHEPIERYVLHGTGLDGIWILEPGLYAVIFGSRLPMAEQFRDWVYWTVLPSLRRAGLLPCPILSEDSSQVENENTIVDTSSFPAIALNAFDGEKVVYLFYLKHYNALKFGRSEDLRDRAQDHYNSYSKTPGDVIAVHVIKTEYPCKVEQEIKDQCKARGWRLSDLYVNGHLQKEIIDLNKTTIDDVIGLMNVVSQQYNESIKQRQADIIEKSVEYQKEITKQLEAKARIAEAETQKEAILLKRLQIEMKNNSNSKKLKISSNNTLFNYFESQP